MSNLNETVDSNIVEIDFSQIKSLSDKATKKATKKISVADAVANITATMLSLSSDFRFDFILNQFEDALDIKAYHIDNATLSKAKKDVREAKKQKTEIKQDSKYFKLAVALDVARKQDAEQVVKNPKTKRNYTALQDYASITLESKFAVVLFNLLNDDDKVTLAKNELYLKEFENKKKQKVTYLCCKVRNADTNTLEECRLKSYWKTV